MKKKERSKERKITIEKENLFEFFTSSNKSVGFFKSYNVEGIFQLYRN